MRKWKLVRFGIVLVVCSGGALAILNLMPGWYNGRTEAEMRLTIGTVLPVQYNSDAVNERVRQLLQDQQELRNIEEY